MNGHQKAADAAIPGTRTGGAPNKHSKPCYATQTSSTSMVKGVTDQEIPFKTPKNLITTTRSIFWRHTSSTENARSKDPGSSVDVKKWQGEEAVTAGGGNKGHHRAAVTGQAGCAAAKREECDWERW